MGMTEADLIDLIVEAVREKIATRKVSAAGDRPATKVGFYLREKYINPRTTLSGRRSFLSEYIVRGMVKPGQSEFIVPKDTILSPLAEDWLYGRSIRIVREGR